MKKAQMFSQPIFYVFVLVVAALFLAWGVKAVFDLKARAELTELVTSVQDIKNVVNSYYNFDVGSARKIDIRMPSKIKYVCFTNHNPLETPQQLNEFGNIKKLMELAEENVFIFPQSAFENNAFKIDYLTSAQDPLCFQTKGSFTAIITNLGKSVEISKNI